MVGIAAGIVGPAVILAFLFNGIVATFTGLAYFELCSAILFSHFIIVSLTLAPIETIVFAANAMFLILVNSVLIIIQFRRSDLKRAFKCQCYNA